MMMVVSLAWVALTGQSPTPPIYFVREDSIYRTYRGNETKLIAHAVGPAPSPDGKRLAFLRDGNLKVLDLEANTTRTFSTFPDKADDDTLRDTFPSWDPTSKSVIFSHLDYYTMTRKGGSVDALYSTEHMTKGIWNVYWGWADKSTREKGDLSLFLGNETSGLSKYAVVSSLAATFSPDGKRVAFCRNGDLWLADLDLSSVHNVAKIASWDEARIFPSAILEGGTRGTTETNAIFRISWSPDGKQLAISTDRYGASGGADIQVFRVDRPTETLVSFPGWDACFLDANHLLYVKPYAEAENIWEYSIDTKDEKMLIPHASEPAVGRA